MGAGQTRAPDAGRERLTAVACLIGGISSFQIGAALAKGLFAMFGPTGMVGLRVGLAALILLAIWRPDAARLRGGVWRILLPYGASIAVMNTAFYVALTRLPLGITVALEFLGPLTLALVGSRRLVDLLWAGLVIAGVSLLLRPERGAIGHLDPWGVAVALLSGGGWIVYILTGTRIATRLNAGYATAYGMGMAGVLLLPCLIPALGPAILHPYEGTMALSVAIMSSAVPYVLDMLAMRRLTPRDMGIMLSMEPMLGAISGLVFLNEQLSLARWLGVLCIVAASAGNVLSGRRASLAAEPLLGADAP